MITSCGVRGSEVASEHYCPDNAPLTISYVQRKRLVPSIETDWFPTKYMQNCIADSQLQVPIKPGTNKLPAIDSTDYQSLEVPALNYIRVSHQYSAFFWVHSIPHNCAVLTVKVFIFYIIDTAVTTDLNGGAPLHQSYQSSVFFVISIYVSRDSPLQLISGQFAH